jgi:hypothetical protein
MPRTPTNMGITKVIEVEGQTNSQNSDAKVYFQHSVYKDCKIITVFASRKLNDLSRTLYKQQPVANFSIMNTRKPGSC